MDPFTLAAIATGAYFLLKKSGKKKNLGYPPIGKKKNLGYPPITVASDCSSWEIPDPWYERYAAPRYAQLAASYPESMALEQRTSLISESLLLGQTGKCVVKDLPNLLPAMRGLLEHIGEYVRSGLRDGGNPFLPGLARYIVATETFRNLPIIVARRPPQGPDATNDPQHAYAWAIGKWGTTVPQIMSELGKLDANNDDEIEKFLTDFGYARTIEEALTKGRARALLGPAVSTTSSAPTDHFIR